MIDIRTDIGFEIYSQSNVPQRRLQQFQELVDFEISRFREQPKELMRQRTAIIAALAHHAAKAGISMHQPTNIIFAIDGMDELTGYRVFPLPKQDTELDGNPSYLGVKSTCMNQGLGTMLVKKSYEALRNLGITKYRTNTELDIVRIYDRLDIPYTILGFPDQHSRGYYLEVTLK